MQAPIRHGLQTHEAKLMKQENKNIIAGAATMVVLALAFVYSYAGKDATADVVGSYPVTAVFNRVDGLFMGDDIYMAGIKIGSVGAMVLDQNFRAVLTLNIDDGVELPTDTSAAVHTDGLFGSKSVMLEPGGEEDLLKAGSIIEYTQGSVVVSELLELIISEGKAKLAKASDETARKNGDR